jgi:four helix bundle protein
MRNFRELRVWDEAHKLTVQLYHDTEDFPRKEMFGLTSQIRRAAASIGANLAEGCGRQSEGEFSRFIQIAMGSASELEYHLLLSRDLAFLTKSAYERAQTQLTRVRKMLASLLQTVQSSRASAAKASS